MKYMNNHFGQSRIFGRAKMPMNLQFFAEADTGGAGGGSGAGAGDTGSGGESEDSESLTVEELLTQLEAERAKSAKLQNEKDTASTEAAKYKKQLRLKMTAEEQARDVENARIEALEADNKKMKEEIRISNYGKRYMGVGMDEHTATELAGLTGEIVEPDKFFSALDKFVKSAMKKAGEDSVEALIKSNPSIKGANGDTDKESEAVKLARASVGRKQNNGFNSDALKQWM